MVARHALIRKVSPSASQEKAQFNQLGEVNDEISLFVAALLSSKSTSASVHLWEQLQKRLVEEEGEQPSSSTKQK